MRRCCKKNKCFIVVECVENKNKKNKKKVLSIIGKTRYIY